MVKWVAERVEAGTIGVVSTTCEYHILHDFLQTQYRLELIIFFRINQLLDKQDLEHIAGFDKTCKSQSQPHTQSPNQRTLCRSFREIFIEIVAAVETLDLNYHLKEAFYARFQPPPSSPTTLNADGFLADFPHFAVGIHKTTTDLLNLQFFSYVR